MATKKKMLQAAAGNATGGAGLNVEDVFSTYLYEGNGSTQNITNGINLGDAYHVLFFGADTGDASNYSTSSTGWETLIDLGNQGTPDVNFFVAAKSVTEAGTESITVNTGNSNSDPAYIAFNAVDFSYKQSSHGSGAVELSNLAANSVVFLLEACDVPQVASYTPPSGFTLLYLNNFADLGTTPSVAVSYQQLDGGSVSTSGGTFSSGNVYRALVEVSAPVGVSVNTEQSGGFVSNVPIFTDNHSVSAPTGVGEGGLVWFKARSGTYGTSQHALFDTDRGVLQGLASSLTSAEATEAGSLTAFNSDGFDLGSWSGVNGVGSPYASWTFRKAPRFFDVVTYTGNGVAGRRIDHNLGVEPGCIILKRTNTTESWVIYHRAIDATSPEDYYLRFDTDARTGPTSVWNYETHTDTNFVLDADSMVNGSGSTYVAYLFAHDPLGPSGDGSDGLIACGSYTASGTTASVDLGWEPQWFIIKRADGTGNWSIHDVMRGLPVGGEDVWLDANTSNAEASYDYVTIRPTGMDFTDLASGGTYIYIAIRRGTKVPESGDEVFGSSQDSIPTFDFPPDATLILDTAGGTTYHDKVTDRLRGSGDTLITNSTAAEVDEAQQYYDFNYDGNQNTFGYAWGGSQFTVHGWKRAPKFFDVVAYTGDGVAGRTVSHNLGVAPEMMWIKRRDGAGNWVALADDVNGDFSYQYLQTNEAFAPYGSSFVTARGASSFTLESSGTVNASGGNFISYLFASLDGVSKVGSYTGNGTSQTIDCGFSAGARFVLIKRTDSTSDWFILDSERGIVAGNDPLLALNGNGAESTGYDIIDPESSGFIINETAWNTNVSGASYIFYAIA